MKIRIYLFAAVLIALSIGLGHSPLVSCSARGALATVPDTLAIFDYFRYTGEDSCYPSHPLTEPGDFYTTILPGWYSDPSVCTNGEGDYFLATSTFSYYPGVPLFHSTDLVHWQQIGNILNRPSQLPLEGQHVSGGIYAPSLAYNPQNKTYYMVTTNVGSGNFFVKTQNPYGDWSEPIPLPEVGGIDPSFFFDEDGRAYIVNNDVAPDNRPEYDGHRTIRVQEFDVAGDSTIGPRKILVNKGVHPEQHPIWIEGPHLYKINGSYFLMAAEGGTGDGHSEVIFRSDSPMGPFVPWKNNPILTQRNLNPARPDAVTCAGHADLIQTKEGDWWAFFLGCRPIDGKFENLGRETFLRPVRWSADGFPYITQGKESIPVVSNRPGVSLDTPAISTFGNFREEISFNDTVLPLSWMTLRGPATEHYSLTRYPGYLALRCDTAKASSKGVPALVCRRMQHHYFTAETKLLFSGKDQRAEAGVLLFKDETHHYFFCIGHADRRKALKLWKMEEGQQTELASQPISGDAEWVQLRVVSRGTHYDFYYAMKDNRWKLLAEGVDASFLSTANAGGFTGTVIALYAVKNR
jgi:alpha-N-arabinofuranosidase